MPSIPQRCQQDDIFQKAWSWSGRAEYKSQSSLVYPFKYSALTLKNTCSIQISNSQNLKLRHLTSCWKSINKNIFRRSMSYSIRRLKTQLFNVKDNFLKFSVVFIHNSRFPFQLFDDYRRRERPSPRPQKEGKPLIFSTTSGQQSSNSSIQQLHSLIANFMSLVQM